VWSLHSANPNGVHGACGDSATDHGDVPLFHEIINRFDYEKNPRLKDMVTDAFRG
jgi:hypothetical protein